MSGVELDDTDRRILDLLGEDARLSNRSLARRLGLVEGTIRARIRRLTQRGLLRFTAITDNRQHGSPLLAFVRVRTDLSATQRLAGEIATIPEIRSVIVMLGRFNLLAIGLFADHEQLTDIAAQQITSLAGVDMVETTIVTRSVKYNERMAKIAR